MNMKRLLSLVAFFATLRASAQQVNPVPDYVFRNQMSVGRNAVTDTGAYFSIGPRYGATKGFMPPIVVDTATFSSGKRNGLLIFSVQKNKFLYWDSVRVQWSDMAGSSGSYIVAGDTASMLAPYLRKSDTTAMLTAYLRKGDTASMLSPYYRSAAAAAALALKLNISDTSSMLANYIRHAGYGLTKSGQSFLVDTLNIATRAWRQKGIDSVVSIIPAAGVGGSGTTNYVAKFTAGSTIGNSQIFDNGTNVGIGTTNPVTKFHISQSNAGNYASVILLSNSADAAADRTGIYGSPSPGAAAPYRGGITFHPGASGAMSFHTGLNNSPADGTRMYIQSNGRIGINTTTDAGYQLDVNGTLRSVNGANFATTIGNVGIGTTTVNAKLHVISPTGTAQSLGDWANNIAIIQGASRTGTTAVGGSFATTISLQSNDDTFAANTGASIGFAGKWNSTMYGSAAQFASIFGGKENATDANLAGYLSFATRPSGGNPTERGRINSAGEWIIDASGTDAGDYKLQVAGNIYTTGNIQMTGSAAIRNTVSQFIDYGTGGSGDLYIRGGSGFANVMTATNAGEVLFNTTTDAGDYKLQVVGNARIGTGKLDIASNTVFGLGVARSGTSEVAGQIYNSNGILYLGAESSTGGQIFSGSSAYAAVIGSGANYPLQFATNNATRATINTNGELLINTTTDNGDFKLQVNGNGLISGSIKTANGGSSTAAAWHLGSVVATSVQLDTANYVEVEINGTYYRLAIVTPL